MSAEGLRAVEAPIAPSMETPARAAATPSVAPLKVFKGRWRLKQQKRQEMDRRLERLRASKAAKARTPIKTAKTAKKSNETGLQIGPWERVRELLNRYDGSLKIEASTGCKWNGELRLTWSKDRFIALHSAGHGSPIACAKHLLRDAHEFMIAEGIIPMRAHHG